MAYRPTNDVKENIIHRNTIFESQGMVSCCTCGHCIEKTQNSTLILNNFKPAPPIINEKSIGSTIIEFSDYISPSSNLGSGEYVLSPDTVQQNLSIRSLADGLIYYPFLNCNGTGSVSLYDRAWGLSVIENNFFTKPVKTYQVEVQSFNYWTPGYPFLSDFYRRERFGEIFDYDTVFGYQFWPKSLVDNTKSNFEWYEKSETGCTQEQINAFALQYNENTSPPNPPSTNTGSLENYFSYINNNDFSVEGFKEYASCSNNIVSLMNPSYFLDVSSYQFSYQHPDYVFLNSVENIYPGPSKPETPISNIFNVVTQWAYDSKNKKMFDPYKGGYVLKDFQINKYGDFSSSLTLLPVYEVRNKKITNKLEILGRGIFDYTLLPPPYDCQCLFKQWTQVFDQEEIIVSYKSIGTSIKSVFPSIYGNNQELIDYKVNGSFSDLYSFVDISGNPNSPKGSPVEEISFGVNKVKNLFSDSYSDVMDQPYVPLKYTASKTNRTQISSSTDSSGKTTLTIKNILWTGKTLLTKQYAHVLGKNVPRLADGKTIPMYYQAILKGGFESDAVISFQSVPLCSQNNIIDRLKRITKLRVNFENYKKILQNYMSNYDAALQFVNATPAVLDLNYYGNVLNTLEFHLGFHVFDQGVYYRQSVWNYNTYVLEFNNIEFFPPNINSENEFIVKNKYSYQSNSPITNYFDFSIIEKNIIEIDPPELMTYIEKPGRVYPDFGVPDKFKSALLINGNADVWKTGNEVNFIGLDYLVTNGGSGYTSVPMVTFSGGGGTGASAYATISNGKVVSITTINKGKNYISNKNVIISGGGGSGATAIDISFTPFYSIFLEEIKNEKQTAGQSLIRIATTLENANNGIYIPNVGLDSLYKEKSLSVKFLSKYKDISLENLPRYENVNLNDPVPNNVNANIINAYYSKESEWKNDFNGILNFSFSSFSSYPNYPNGSGLNISFKDADGSIIRNYDYLYYFSSSNNYFSNKQNQFFETISLSPLKIKYKNVKFDAYGGDLNLYNYPVLFNYAYKTKDYSPLSVPKVIITPMNPILNYYNSFVGLSTPGFQCDVVLEEIVDEFIQEALPVEFNQILEGVEYIQTSNLMNARKPLQMINPEKCEHIGKVIDRKDCNCPKKWIRECDIHGKTDWKKCMTCKDFKLSE